MKNKFKLTSHKNYGSIPHLSDSLLGASDRHIEENQEDILTIGCGFNWRIIVQEKYDGSNVGIIKKDGRIFALTRKGFLADSLVYLQYQKFANWVDRNSSSFSNLLGEGERIVGEWLYQVHGIKYNIEDKKNPIVFYDIFNKHNKRIPYFDFVKRIEHAPRLIKPARVLHVGGAIPPRGLIRSLYESDSRFFATSGHPEGMVYRAEKIKSAGLKTETSVSFLAKWVRHDFVAGRYMIDVEDKDLIYNVSLR